MAHVCLSQTSNSIHQNKQETSNSGPEEPQEIYLLQANQSDKFIVSVQIEDKPVNMEVDTGAAVTIMSHTMFKNLNLNKRLFKTNVQLRTYTGESFLPNGAAFVQCKYKHLSFTGKLFVVNKDVDTIVGRD